MGAHSLYKFTHMIGTRETRFIYEEESLLLWFGLHILPACKKSLQCSRLNTRLLKLLRSAGSWCETFYLVTLCFSRTADRFQCRGFTSAGHTLNSLNAVGRTQYVFNDSPLSSVQVGTLVHGDDGILARHHWLDLVLTFAHLAHNLELSSDCPNRCESAAW